MIDGTLANGIGNDETKNADETMLPEPVSVVKVEPN